MIDKLPQYICLNINFNLLRQLWVNSLKRRDSHQVMKYNTRQNLT